MLNLYNFNKTLSLLLFFVLLSACAPVTTAPTEISRRSDSE